MDTSLIVAAVLVGAALLAFEVGISSAIVEIIAGVLLAFFMADIGSLDWLQFLANLGMLGLMFMAGFEVDINRLRHTWRASVGIGVLSFALPLAGVFAVCFYWLEYSPLVAGLVAIGLSTTSLALVYHALRDRGMLDSETGQTLLAAASVVDVLSMVSLALLMGDVGWGTAIFVIVVVPTIFGLPRLGRWIFRRYKGSIVELELRFMLVLLIGMGFMAENVGGIHPAVVAFAIGVVMSEVMDEHEALEEKLKGIVFSLLGPVFFLQAGTQLDVRLLTPEMLGVAGVLFVTACALKFTGSALPAHWLMKSQARFVGLLFNYRLSFGIIAASVGLKSGILTEDIYAVMLLIVIGSAALPVIFLHDRPDELS
ncbi:MAG: cation:proton antiporter [Alphaproteobacteria bacterium]|nr:cation:proton antiporter [Alphaproteobacteria bacterium]